MKGGSGDGFFTIDHLLLHILWGMGLDSATWHRQGRALGKHLGVLLGLTVRVMVGKVLVRVIVILEFEIFGILREISLGRVWHFPWN